MGARLAVVIVAMAGWPAALWSSQAPTVATAAGVVHVHAPAFHFLDGEAIARLRDGQLVRIDLQLSVLAGPGAAASTGQSRTFVLSYDLWEERFAVSFPGAPRRAVSHLTAAAAEAWCVQQLQVPVKAMGTLGRDVPFWIRLDARMIDGAAVTRDDEGLTLQRLIELLSRRRKTDEASHTIEAGPFRIKE